MATYLKGQSMSLAAAADLTTKQFFAVKVDSNGKAALAAAGEFAIGVLQNNPAINQVASIQFSGTTKAVAGGTIAAGAMVTVDANGKFVTATGGRTNTSDAGVAADALLGSNVFGIALTAAVANDIFSVAIVRAGAVPTTPI